MPACDSTDISMICEIEPQLEELFERHLATARTWYPHEVVRRDDNRGAPVGRAEWTARHPPLSDAVKSALFINVLTEDNLPYYTATGLRKFEASEVLVEWMRRWTAEESRHSIAIRDWIIEMRALDPWELEDARFEQLCRAVVPDPPSVAEALVYTTFQELATNVAHRNTARHLVNDDGGRELMALVAGDEMAHYRFYRDAAAASLQVAPSHMMRAVASQLLTFEMPGVGIRDFRVHANRVARAGIFDPSAYQKCVVDPILEYWQLEAVEGLDSDGERARDAVLRHASRLRRLVRIRAERQSATSHQVA